MTNARTKSSSQMYVPLPNEQAGFQIHFLFVEKYQLLYRASITICRFHPFVFSLVISTILVCCCCFCTLRIDQSIAWSFIFPFCHTYFFDQCFLYFIPYSIHTGSSIKAIYCLPLRKIFWQVPPLTPCFHQVKYRIHLFSLFFYASISRFL